MASNSIRSHRKVGLLNYRSLSTASPSPQLSLRKSVSPFLMLCHPDKVVVSSSTSAETNDDNDVVRKVNLDAIQTLNNMIDTIEQTLESIQHSRTISASDSIRPAYAIEFMVPTTNNDETQTRQSCVYTRREVCLTFPPELQSMIQGTILGSIAATTSKQGTVQAVQNRTRQEINKLLTAAGLPLLQHETSTTNQTSSVEDEGSGSANGFRFGGGVGHLISPSRLKWGLNQNKPPPNIDWNRWNARMKRAEEGMMQDIATMGFTTPRKKRRVVAGVLSRVRVSDEGVTVTLLEQATCLRRLGILLQDCYEDLDMEDHGRVWDQLVIVLKHEDEEGLNRQQRIRNRRKQNSMESGYKFSWGSKDKVTITIPTDFDNAELVQEFRQHLSFFYTWEPEYVY